MRFALRTSSSQLRLFLYKPDSDWPSLCCSTCVLCRAGCWWASMLSSYSTVSRAPGADWSVLGALGQQWLKLLVLFPRLWSFNLFIKVKLCILTNTPTLVWSVYIDLFPTLKEGHGCPLDNLKCKEGRSEDYISIRNWKNIYIPGWRKSFVSVETSFPDCLQPSDRTQLALRAGSFWEEFYCQRCWRTPL